MGGDDLQYILVDYLTLSVSLNHFSVDDICGIVGVNREDMTDIKSRLGLHNCLLYGGIKIHYHEHLEDIKKPLIVLDMSGKGCRLLETIKDGTGFDWIDFIEQFLCTEGSHIARLDIACDDKVIDDNDKSLLSFPTMVRHIKERRYISQATRKIYTDGDEQSIIFGAPSSDRRFRIYNKQLEKGYDRHWIRAEFQLRNDAALSFYMRALERADIGQAYYGMLYAYLRYTREVNQQNDNQSKLTVCRWWQKFCNNAKKIKGFYLGGVDYNMGRLKNYIRTQPASSLKTLMEINGGDIGELVDMFSNTKLNKQQEYLIKIQALEREIFGADAAEAEQFRREGIELL